MVTLYLLRVYRVQPTQQWGQLYRTDTHRYVISMVTLYLIRVHCVLPTIVGYVITMVTLPYPTLGQVITIVTL